MILVLVILAVMALGLLAENAFLVDQNRELRAERDLAVAAARRMDRRRVDETDGA